MSSVPLACPNCDSNNVAKNGFIHNSKQDHRYNDCGRQFVEDPQNKVITDETKETIAFETSFYPKLRHTFAD